MAAVIADFDFETYSEAGFDFRANRWRPVGNAQKGGLPAVGAAVYAEHPSTEVLSLAYDLKDGRGKRLWAPGLPAPTDLFDYLATGQPIEAHNAMFEYWIWQRVCHERYGWPRLPITQLRDSAAKCRAYGLPGALGKAATVMGTTAKIADGDRLIKKFSVPRNPTKADKRLRIRPEDDPADAMNLYAYNLGDIEAEAELSAAVPYLPPDELEFWYATMAMNERGVAIDLPAVESAIAILEQAYVKYDTELAGLTDDAVDAASKVQALRTWLVTQGVKTKSLDDEAVTALLGRKDLTYRARRALEIRSAVGSAGVKKVYAMKRRACRDGRVKDLFIYHGARTGRDTGADVQPQNLVKAGVKLRWCAACEKPSGKALFKRCPHCHTMSKFYKFCKCGAKNHPDVVNCKSCGSDELKEVVGWSHEATDDVIQTLHTRSLTEVERVWGDAALAISGCIRGLFIADEGKELICSDYSSIEAVVTAMLAGEEWRIEAFRQKKDIYLTSAAAITKKDYAWYAENGGKSHPDRQKIGKPAELACLSAETKVLTDRGYLDIVDVTKKHKLWDGGAWITHQGLVYKGKRPVIKLDGVRITPDHLVNLKGSWKEAKQLVTNEHLKTLALESGSENLPQRGTPNVARTASMLHGFNALVKRHHILSRCITYVTEKAHGVIHALKRLRRHTVRSILVMLGLWRTKNIGLVSSTGSLLQSGGAITQIQETSITTEAEALRYVTNGEMTEDRFYYTSRLLKDGITRISTLTASIQTVIMNLGILDLFHVLKTTLINEVSENLKNELPNWSDVYDIALAGPKNQFTIKTDSGHLIVHNCGFGGWIGAWRQFDKSDNWTDDQVKKNINAWREVSPMIVELWGGQKRGKPWENGPTEFYGLEGAAIKAVMRPGETFSYRLASYVVENDVLFAILPSGRRLAYHKPRLRLSTKREGELQITYMTWNSNPKMGPLGWVEMETYGGRLTENAVQAVARDIMAHAVPRLERAGYPVVLRVHDEVASEVPIGYGSIEEFERIMADLPEWAKDWPIRAAGGWRGKRYRKD